MPRRSAADINTRRFELVRTTPLDLPAPPAHLAPATQEWWRAIVRDYEFGPHHLRLLEAACGAWDRMEQARETLQRVRDGSAEIFSVAGLAFHNYAGGDDCVHFFLRRQLAHDNGNFERARYLL